MERTIMRVEVSQMEEKKLTWHGEKQCFEWKGRESLLWCTKKGGSFRMWTGLLGNFSGSELIIEISFPIHRLKPIHDEEKCL